jgi:hypothetical protein
MARRFQHKNMSIPYINSLKQVKIIPVMPQSRRAPRVEGTIEDESDRLFLVTFVATLIKCPQSLKSSIPTLIEMAKELLSNHGIIGQDFELYTNETSTEFHHLLLELIDDFKDALVVLGKATKDNHIAITRAVDGVHRNGYALLRLARGCAFQMHLENIKFLLEDPHQPYDKNLDGEPNEEFDEELEAIRSVLPPTGSDGAEKALVKSYVAWLRLMVGHFDAVEILVRFVTSQSFPYNHISVEILLAPRTDNNLLPWRELFTKNYIPQSGAKQLSSTVTNQQIQDFLETNILLVSEVQTAQDALDAWSRSELLKTCQVLNELTKSHKKDVESKAMTILELLPKKLKNRDPKITQELQALRNMMVQPPGSNDFFLNLDSKKFTGTLHCEACLASLLPSFTEGLSTDDSNDEETSPGIGV